MVYVSEIQTVLDILVIHFVNCNWVDTQWQ